MLSLSHDSQQASALDADLDQLAREMNQLHEAAHLVGNDGERAHFARLEQRVYWRLNQLAYALAARDTWHSNNPQA